MTSGGLRPERRPRAARVELTVDGEVLHERVRAAMVELTSDVSAGVARGDLETAGCVLVEIAREARAWLESDLGARFGK